jgi:predicted RNA-binding Zn-ribbon protein involved in translation (DUF1610 family)
MSEINDVFADSNFNLGTNKPIGLKISKCQTCGHDLDKFRTDGRCPNCGEEQIPDCKPAEQVSEFTEEIRTKMDEMDNGGTTYKRESMEADLLYACDYIDRQAKEIDNLKAETKNKDGRIIELANACVDWQKDFEKKVDKINNQAKGKSNLKAEIERLNNKIKRLETGYINTGKKV